ncbi:MAG: DUF1003 domain-containing protein [Patescibacteria group bacterium]
MRQVDHDERRPKHYWSLKAAADAKRSITEIIADDITRVFGSFWFATAHIVWFVLWILINSDRLPGLSAFDPFPFGLLTMIVSLEAIFLSIFVLISQNRAQKTADLREEISLKVTTQSEKEVTETLRIVDQIAKHLKVKIPHAQAARNYEKDLDSGALKRQIEKEI